MHTDVRRIELVRSERVAMTWSEPAPHGSVRDDKRGRMIRRGTCPFCAVDVWGYAQVIGSHGQRCHQCGALLKATVAIPSVLFNLDTGSIDWPAE